MKVLVLYGTNPFEFTTMNQVLRCAPVNWEIIVQYGNSKLSPELHNSFSFIKQGDLLKLTKEVDAILCQGGYGSIWLGLESAKPIYVIPRNTVKQECLDDQDDLADYYEGRGLVRKVSEFSLSSIWEYIASDYHQFQHDSQIALSRYIAMAPRIDLQISSILDSENDDV